MKPSDYFDLSKFEHAALFDPNEPAWSALKKINDYLLASPLGVVQGTIERGAYLINPEGIFIGKGTVVEAGAYIVGPCIIGENCQIRNGAYIRGDVLVGRDCVIGHATEAKNAIFLDGAQAGHFAYVGDSILGNRVNVGAGTKCANLRFDRQNVTVSVDGKKIDTGLRKFGVIMGDDSQTGCNVVTNPGTMMGKKSCVIPCSSVHGVIPENIMVYESI